MEPDEVVITHDPGVIVKADDKVYHAPFKPPSLEGAWARGDTCIVTYIGKRFLGASVENATYYAAALTTLKLEEPGPFRGNLEEVLKLLENLEEG